MKNEEAKERLMRLIVELKILAKSDFNADNKDNIEKAIDLLEEVGVWPYED